MCCCSRPACFPFLAFQQLKRKTNNQHLDTTKKHKRKASLPEKGEGEGNPKSCILMGPLPERMGEGRIIDSGLAWNSGGSGDGTATTT